MKNLDKATGTIAGLAVGGLVGLLMFGVDDYDNAPWKVTAGLLALGGIIGFFVGKRAESERFKNRLTDMICEKSPGEVNVSIN